MSRTIAELVDAYLDQNKAYCTEGRKGWENLALLVKALGYKDPQYYGQLSNGSSVGTLLNFLEDNSGAIEAVIEWVKDTHVHEWADALESQVEPEEEYDDEDEE